MSKIQFMQGNEACVHGALRAGMRFFSGYPITPSSEIAEESSIQLPKVGGKFIQMEDEIAGCAAAVGASIAGLKAMTATSGPGFSLKQETIGFACITEVPVVIVNIMRMGPSTGLPTSPSQGDIMQARFGTHGDHPVIALCPTSVQEMYTMTVRAFNLAEKYRTPVILTTDEVIAHLREGIVIPETVEVFDRTRPESPEGFLPYKTPEGAIVPPMPYLGQGYHCHVTGLSHTEAGAPTNSTEVNDKLLRRLLDKVEKNYDDIVEIETVEAQDAEVLLVCVGSVARASKEVVAKFRAEGKKVGLFIPKTLWPFPEKELSALLSTGRVKNVVVPEMNAGQLKLEVERITAGRASVVPVNKISGDFFTMDEIVNAVQEVL